MRLVAAGALIIALAGCSTTTDDVLVVDARLNGIKVDEGTRTGPLELAPDEPVLLELSVENPTAGALNVRHIRVEGEVLEMRFAHANTAVDFTVDAGETRDFAFEIDFFDLGEQVTGHLDSQLSLHDGDREPLATQQFFVSVAGDMTSSLGVTVLMMALFAGVSLVVNLFGVARGTLPANRWYRGLRFAFTGGTAATLVLLLLPLVGLWLAPMGVWIPVLGTGIFGGFLLGYLSPSPDDVLDLTDERILTQVA